MATLESEKPLQWLQTGEKAVWMKELLKPFSGCHYLALGSLTVPSNISL